MGSLFIITRLIITITKDDVSISSLLKTTHNPELVLVTLHTCSQPDKLVRLYKPQAHDRRHFANQNKIISVISHKINPERDIVSGNPTIYFLILTILITMFDNLGNNHDQRLYI